MYVYACKFEEILMMPWKREIEDKKGKREENIYIYTYTCVGGQANWKMIEKRNYREDEMRKKNCVCMYVYPLRMSMERGEDILK